MPTPRNLAQEYRQTLNAQHYNAPLQFQDEATFQPLYQNLNLQNIDWLLNGSPEQQYTTYGWQQPVYLGPGGHKSGGNIGPAQGLGLANGGGSGGSGSNPASWFSSKENALAGLSGGTSSVIDLFQGKDPLAPFLGGDKPKKKLLSPGRYVATGTATRGAQRGLLKMYEEDILPSQARQATYQRKSDIADVMNLGPEARKAIAAANPEIAGILAKLEAQASGELDLGATLDPSQMRNVSQVIRSRQAGTLMSNGNAGSYDEALRLSQYGDQLRNQRRAFAGNVMGLDQSLYGDVFNRILNRSSGNAGLGTLNQAQGVGAAAGAKQFNPESPYAADLYNTNFNAAVAQAINAANNRTALIGAGIGAAGSIAGGALGAFCWVAREVYGEENPRWRLFREWLCTKAPRWFFELYRRHGEAFAAWLRNKPTIKALIRKWMDARIKGD